MVLTNHSALAPHRFPASDPLLPLDPAMRFTSILTLAAASAITTVQAAGNFGASCKDIATLVGGTDLVASCRKSNGSYVYAQLDMNKCVANYGGHLACASNGNFGKSCSGCGISRGTTTLGCTCKPGSSSTTINLNDCIANRDGALVCA